MLVGGGTGLHSLKRGDTGARKGSFTAKHGDAGTRRRGGWAQGVECIITLRSKDEP